MAPSPRSYMPVMVVATVPTVTLALFALGAFDRLRVLVLRTVARLRAELRSVREPKGAPASEAVAIASLDPPVVADRFETDFLFLLALAVPLAVFPLQPKFPIFGGTKHWLPAYPFLAVFAGRGFAILLAALRRAWPKLEGRKRLGASLALAFAVFLGPLCITAHSHPFGLSSYVPLVGGTAGGADLGLNRQFWGFTTQSVGPWLEKNAPRRASVFIHDTSWDAWQEMLDEGRIRPDLRGVGSPSEADISLVQHELHMNELDYAIWLVYGTVAPVYVLTQDNVPIVSVYRRR
jgi:hypothetical protein